MGTVHTCHQVNQLRPLHFVTPSLVIPRESESGTMLVSTAFYFLSERPCLLTGQHMHVQQAVYTTTLCPAHSQHQHINIHVESTTSLAQWHKVQSQPRGVCDTAVHNPVHTSQPLTLPGRLPV